MGSVRLHCDTNTPHIRQLYISAICKLALYVEIKHFSKLCLFVLFFLNYFLNKIISISSVCVRGGGGGGEGFKGWFLFVFCFFNWG